MIKKVYFRDRNNWRKWLRANYRTGKEIWLMNPHNDTGLKKIPYNDAVEEALCFGWIDSTVRNINKNYSAQRFTPRNPGTPYSQANRERLKYLVKKGLVMPDVQKAVKKVLKEKFVFPPDIMKMIRRHKAAWNNFKKYPAAYRRIRLAFVDGARNRPEEFKKRLNYLIKTAGQNRMIGYGGVDKFYSLK